MDPYDRHDRVLFQEHEGQKAAGKREFITRRYHIATYKKIPRKKVAPVQKEFIGHVEQLILKLLPHWKQAVGVLVAAVLVFCLLWAVSTFLKSKDETAAVKFFEITKMSDEATKVAKLEEFIEKNGGTPSADQANLWLGGYFFGKNDNKKAIDFYKKVVEKTEGKPIYFMAVESLAPVYVANGEALEGAELYLEAGEMSSNPAPFTYKVKAAEIYKLAGKSDDAKKILNEIIADKNASEEVKRQAQEKLLWIDISSN